MDDLIKAAQAQQARMQQRPSRSRTRGQMARPQPQPDQQRLAQGPRREGGEQPAQISQLGQGNDPKADPSQELKQSQRDWAILSPRDRRAVEQTANEKEIGKYLSLIHDYYKSLAEQAKK